MPTLPPTKKRVIVLFPDHRRRVSSRTRERVAFERARVVVHARGVRADLARAREGTRAGGLRRGARAEPRRGLARRRPRTNARTSERRERFESRRRRNRRSRGVFFFSRPTRRFLRLPSAAALRREKAAVSFSRPRRRALEARGGRHADAPTVVVSSSAEAALHEVGLETLQAPTKRRRRSRGRHSGGARGGRGGRLSGFGARARTKNRRARARLRLRVRRLVVQRARERREAIANAAKTRELLLRR